MTKQPTASIGKVFLQPRQVADLAYRHGVTDFYDLATAVAVCKAESQYGVNAFHDNLTVITAIKAGTLVRNQETYEMFMVVDPATGEVKHMDGTVEHYPLTVTPVTSRDVGLWQINIAASAMTTVTEKNLYDPEQNAAAMFRLYEARGFQPWAAFNSGVYLHDGYAGHAALAVCNLAVDHFNKAGASLPLPLFSTKDLRTKLGGPQ